MQVYVISIPRAVSRRALTQQECDKFGIKPVWIFGDDRQEMHGFPKDYQPERSMATMGRLMGFGEIGCLRGHLRAYQALIDGPDEWAVLMEDDAVLLRDPREALSGYEGRMVYGFDTLPHNSAARSIYSRHGREVMRLNVVPYGAVCYAIHRSYAARCLAYLAMSLYAPADVFHVWYAKQHPAPVYWQVMGVSKERDPQSSVIGDDARMIGCHPSAWRTLETHDNAPMLIHQIWMGANPPLEHLSSWVLKNPRRLHHLWNLEQCHKICQDYGVGQAFEAYAQPGGYPAAADVARYCILHRFGGFYADADSLCLRELDLRNEFLVFESERYRPGLLCNGFIQVKAGSPLMEEMIKEISITRHPSEPAWQHTGPGLLTRKADPYPTQRMPSGYFLPQHFMGPNDPVTGPYANHDWDRSSTMVRGAGTSGVTNSPTA